MVGGGLLGTEVHVGGNVMSGGAADFCGQLRFEVRAALSGDHEQGAGGLLPG